MIIYGTRTYGRIDEIENLGAVETKFFHLFWFPLLPMGSMFVFDDDDDDLEDNEKRVVMVGFSFKSMFVAWTRAFLVLMGFGLLSGIMMLVEGEEDTMESLVVLGVGVTAWVLFFVVGSFTRKCSPQRRAELLAMTGMSAGVPHAAGHHQHGAPQAGPMVHPNAAYGGTPAAHQGWPQGAAPQQAQAAEGAWPQGAAPQQGYVPGPHAGQAMPQQPPPQGWPQQGPPPGQGGYGGPQQS